MTAVAIDLGVCTLRSFREDDAEPMTAIAADHDIWMNVSDHFPHPYTREHARAFIARQVGRHPARNLAICVDDRVAGGAIIRPGEGISRVSAEIGYWLGRDYRGRGVGTAVARGVSDYAFEHFKVSRVFAIAFARNTGSVRVLEKAGFQREGHMRQSAIKEGVVEDEYLYARYRMED